MKLAGLVIIILGIIVLVISGLIESASNPLLATGGLMIIIGLILYIIFNRYAED